MVEITKANLRKHSSGDQTKITVEASNIQDNYTFTVPHLRTIEDWYLAPTTEADWGGSVSGNVITLRSGTTITGRIAVYGR